MTPPAFPARGGGHDGPALAVRNIAKRFGDTPAVNDVSFSVPGGSFLSLLGPSGSGKTTVLRLLGGFESPDSGTMEIDGVDITRLPPHRRDIGVVFQRYALFPHMSVAANVEFPLKQRGMARAERTSRVDEMLDAVGLAGYGDRHTSQLSGGEQQRVALARALVFKPRMLLMDEPLAALDKRLREEMQQEIRQLQRRFGMTTVYITHDQTEAFVMSDLVAVMHAGRVEQIAAPRELYEAPRTEFVAQFVGDSNLFRGEPFVLAGATAMRLADGTTLRYADTPDGTAPASLLVRPEKIDIDRASDSSGGDNLLRGKIVDATFLGENIDYRILAGGQRIIVRQQNRAGLQARQPGTDVTLSWSIADTVPL